MCACGIPRYPESVRPELVEGLSFFFIVAKKGEPFDKLRANGDNMMLAIYFRCSAATDRATDCISAQRSGMETVVSPIITAMA